MRELSVDAIAVAVVERPDYRPAAGFGEAEHMAGEHVLPLAQAVGVPADELRFLALDDGPTANDVATRALMALGVPGDPQPLFLVRSGPLRDPYVAELARLVDESGWPGDDVGLTHLDELGGTVVFDLLGWAGPEWTVATVVVVDEPAYVGVANHRPYVAAVALRVRRGPGALRVLGCGEGPPPRPEPGGTRLDGVRACDGWLALHRGLMAGRVADGDRILLHTKGFAREGWLSLSAVDVASVCLADAASPLGSLIV